jgi:isopentenyldiphosphate isomerase
MTTLLWQLYDLQGRPKHDGGAAKLKAIMEGTLHGSAHVWIWRHTREGVEVLLQKRSSAKINWPKRFDKSAGGHITYGEEPLDAAIRKAKAELGLVLPPAELQLIGVCHWHAPVDGADMLENDFQWLYIVELPDPKLTLPTTEVESVIWKPVTALRQEVDNDAGKRYVPYGQLYYQMLQDAITRSVG